MCSSDLEISKEMPKPPASAGSDDATNRGLHLYNIHCLRCHGAGLQSGGVIADLRYMSEGSHELFQQIVRGGLFESLGMISFADVLTEKDAEDIHHYIIATANRDWAAAQSSDWWQSIRNWSYDKAAVLLEWLMAPGS